MPNNIKYKEKSATLRVLPVKNKLHAKDSAIRKDQGEDQGGDLSRPQNL